MLLPHLLASCVDEADPLSGFESENSLGSHFWTIKMMLCVWLSWSKYLGRHHSRAVMKLTFWEKLKVWALLMSVFLWSSVLGFCSKPTSDTNSTRQQKHGALKQLEESLIHSRHASQLELELYFHVLSPLTYLSFHSKDYTLWGGETDHLTLEEKKQTRNGIQHNRKTERTARGHTKITGKNRCITALFSK